MTNRVTDRPDSGFAERVLDRVAVEEERRQQFQVGHVAPLVAILVVGSAWAVSLALGVTVVRLAIDALAWLSAVSQLERHLSAALLGPFAPLPLVVSVFLFVAAVAWVRVHQPDPPEVSW